MKGLSAKQQRFIEELRADKNRNATAAYRRANPDCKNDNVAAAASARLLRSVKVKEAIMAADEESLKRAEITADWVLERMRIEALREGEGASHSARVTALKLLGSCHNLFPDKHEVTGRNGSEIKLGLNLTQALEADDELDQWQREHAFSRNGHASEGSAEV